jgi:hypothetical protein
MRISCFALLAFLTPTAHLRADDAADARAVVARATKAAGISTDGKPLTVTYKVKGQNMGGGFENAFTGEMAFQGPDKYRMTVISGVSGKVEMPRRGPFRRRVANELNGILNGITIDVLLVVNGKKAWMSVQGTSQEVTGEQLEKLVAQAYQQHVMSLAPLLIEEEFKLSTAGEIEVNSKKAAAVKVERNKKQALTLFFDKESGLLAKVEMKAKDESQGGKEVTKEVYFEDYKDVGGRKYYTKMRLIEDGKLTLVDTLSDHKMQETLDPKLFESNK